MSIEEVERPEPFRRPVEKVCRLRFDEDEDQEAFRMMWCALCHCEPNFTDVRMMFVAARLFAKLEKFSVPAPDGVDTIGRMRRQRMLPPYPGHPVELDLTPDEMALVELCLQLVPWGVIGLEWARLAAFTLEWMLKSELVEVDLIRDLERQANAAYEAGTLHVDGEKVK